MPSVTRSHNDDPLTRAMNPPANETAAERKVRLENEHEARIISKKIDNDLKAEREAIKAAEKTTYKLLLLGQSDSGKSTLLRQFQLMYDPARLDKERESWLPVIHLNVIRTTRVIFDALEWKQLNDHAQQVQNDGYSSDDVSEPSTRSTLSFDALPALRAHLDPLLAMEPILAKRLGIDVQVGGRNMLFAKNGWQKLVRTPLATPRITPPKELSEIDSFELGPMSEASSTHHGNQGAHDFDMDVRTAHILGACKSEILSLWNHPWLPELLKKRMFQLEESSGFFMSQLDRIANPGYVPDNDDILHARLRTMGIVEHVFHIRLEQQKMALDWKLYDVGGSRGQRHSWVPYFEDARAIIFLAPISSFNQSLEEDVNCNRVEDSLQLFKYITAHPLLQKVHLVLFLNKIDVLRKKLQAGSRVVKYIPSYGKRSNDVESVCKYFLAYFKQAYEKSLPEDQAGPRVRRIYTHLTSVIDTATTRKIIVDIVDAITRAHFKDSTIL